jgi:hypothetical protein
MHKGADLGALLLCACSKSTKLTLCPNYNLQISINSRGLHLQVNPNPQVCIRSHSSSRRFLVVAKTFLARIRC